MKKPIALLLCLTLVLSLCACGVPDDSIVSLGTVGTKHYRAICRSGDRLAPVITAALETLAANGTVSALTSRWLGADRCAMKGSADALAKLEEMPERRTLIIGVETEFEPIAYTVNGELVGLAVDLARAMGELLGWETLILPITSDQISAQLTSGNVDCALGFDAVSLKEEKFTWSESFLNSDIIVAARAGSDVKRFKDLTGCRVGTVQDPVVLQAIQANEKLTKYAAGATQYLSVARCIEAMDKGWCAAVVMDSMTLAFFHAE